MVALFPKVTRTFLVLALVALLFLGFLGIGHFGMTGSGGQMSNCPFMGMTAICQMSPLQHIAAWQRLFTISPTDPLTLLLLLLLALAATLSIASLWQIQKYPPDDYRRRRARSRVDTPIVFASLLEALSRGIIHPRIF